MREFRQRLVFLVILFIVFTYYGNAQTHSKTLPEVLKELELQYDLSFSFASDLVEGIEIENYIIDNLDSVLISLSETTNFSFEKVGDRNYLIAPKKLDVCLIVLDVQGGVLPGAYVITNNQFYQTVSDINGKLEFESNLTIKDSIKVRYLGFEDKSISVASIYSKPCLPVKMNLGHTLLNEVVVKNYMAPGIKTSSEDHSIQIKTSDMALLPGETDGDILLSLRTIPGITAPNGKAGNLHVRGSTSDQTLVLFDNIPIYHKGHYLGAVSPYNPKMVNNIEIHRSGYEPRLGGRVGGAIEFKTARNVIDSIRTGVGLNTFYGSAFAKVPIIKDKLMVSAAYRQSYPSSFSSPKLDAIKEMVYHTSALTFADKDPNREVTKNEFDFNDFNSNLVFKLKKGIISASFLNVDNKSNGIIENTNNTSTSFITLLDNWGVSSDWSQYWTSRLSTTLSVMNSDYNYYSDVSRTDQMGKATHINTFSNGINDLSIQANSKYILSKTKDYKIDFGYSLNQQKVSEYSLIRPNGVAAEKSVNTTGNLHSLFLNFSASLFQNKLSINSGVRSNYYNQLNNYRIEPRIFLNYNLFRSISLKSSFGLYSQYINQLVYFDFEDSKVENLTWLLAGETPIVTSSQGMFGGVFSKAGWTVDLELYRKEIDGLTTRNPYAQPDSPNTFINGKLTAIGLDLLVKKSWNKFYVWSSYTYSYSTMDFNDLNQLTFLTYYDQPNVLSLVATWPIKSWSFSAGWNYASGTPNYLNASFFPSPGGEQVVTPPSTTPSETNDGRFAPQHQLDLSVVYSFPKNKGWKGTIGLSILNVYDHENLIEEAYVTFGPTTSQESRYAIGFAPNLTVNIEF